MTLLTLLQNDGSTPPQPPTPEQPHGQGSTVYRDFPLRGEKRKRLPKSVVKRAKKLAQEPEITLEKVGDIAELAIPLATEDDTASLLMIILAQYENNLKLLALQEFAEQQAREAAILKMKERLILEAIAEYLDILEQDEMLLLHLI